MNWTKAKNIAKLGGALAISAGASVLVLECPYFNISLFLKCNVDFHYNAISMSATIGGFLFTGISILISTLENVYGTITILTIFTVLHLQVYRPMW